MLNQPPCSYSNSSWNSAHCTARSSTPTSPRQPTPATSRWYSKLWWTQYSETISEKPPSYSCLQSHPTFHLFHVTVWKNCLPHLRVWIITISIHFSCIEHMWSPLCHFLLIQRPESIFANAIYIHCLHSILRIYAWNAVVENVLY